nr:MAG TPA: hypothetical protein [Caudoviricetes sp.]
MVLACRDGICHKPRLSSGPSRHDVNWHERTA